MGVSVSALPVEGSNEQEPRLSGLLAYLSNTKEENLPLDQIGDCPAPGRTSYVGRF